MNRYNIDFLGWMWRTLPRPLQRSRNIQLLWGIAASLRKHQAELMAWGQQTLYEMRWNGQTLLLERMLQLELRNDLIRLENIARKRGGVYIGQEDKTKARIGMEDDSPMRISSEGGLSGVSAIVWVPRYLESKEELIRALLKKYKMEQVQYTIIYFDPA